MLVMGWPFRERILRARNDFLMLYAGAKLAGSPDLYDAVRVRQVQVEWAGATGDALRFARPPHYALLLWPLGRLSFVTAYLVWQVLSVLALLAFTLLWPSNPRSVTAMFSCLSVPIFLNLMNGGDVFFLLLWVTLALRCQRRGWSFLAGLILSLCAAKFQLFLLLPLLIAAQRLWRVGLGLAAGAVSFLGLSFAAAGSHWPQLYYHVLTAPIVQKAADTLMPNLHGVLGAGLGLEIIEWFGIAVVVAAVWYVSRRSCFEYAFAAVLAGGLLVSYHSYLPDCSLLIPAALLVLSLAPPAWLRWVAVGLLLPVIYFTGWWRELLVTGMFAFVVGIGFETWQRATSAAASTTAG